MTSDVGRCPVCHQPVRVTQSIVRPLFDVHTNSLGRLCIGSGEPYIQAVIP
jgi:hypothetical protein